MPRRVSYQLQWSAPTQEYIILHDSIPVAPRIEPDSQPWFAWLETISSFSFQSRSGGSCTVRKESVQRGGAYWYAYRRQGTRMVKRYLARDLTLARLEMATTSLDATLSDSEQFIAPAIETTHASKQATTSPPSRETTIPLQPLITTKQHPPRLPAQYVSRPRLLELLEQGIQRPLTLVSAPAGSGKTTLLAEWAAQSALPLAWISLEPADNDPARFLSYLMAALASLDMRIDSTYQPAHDPEHALTTMLNALSKVLQQEAIVILDDYHCLTTETTHALLRFILDHLPTQLHLMIGTRIDPPLSLARLRARRHLSEIRAETLRFASDEVEALANTMGLALSSEATGLLEQHTEGWIAGVQLLVLALRGHTDATAFLRTFRGTHRFLLDYVSEEVLAQQTPETQRFLLRTCILERMIGSLCDALTGLPDGQAQLAELLRANLFVSALDDTETWYRYHPLFAETLRAHLQKLEPELLPELYLQASRWYEQQQSKEEACDYAFLAADFPRAAQLLTDLLPQMIERGHFAQLGHWLDQLPPELIATSPQLYIVTPWLYSSSLNSPDHMEQTLKHMEQHVQKQQQNTANAWVEPQSILTMLHAVTAMTQNNLPRAFSLIRTALHTLTRRKTALSQLLSHFFEITLSITYGASGDLASAEQVLLDLVFLQEKDPFSLIHLAALFLLGELYTAQGRRHKAEELYANFDRMFTSHADIPPVPLLVIGFGLIRRTSLLYEWNRLPEAARDIQRVLEILPRAIQGIAPQANRPALFAFGLWAQARVEWAQGRPEAALYFFELLLQQPEIMEQRVSGKERPLVTVPILAARLALCSGRIAEADEWEKDCGIRFDDVPKTLLAGREVFAYMTLARILIRRGRKQHSALSEALILLENWRKLALQLGFQSWLIEIQMLTTLALQEQGNTRQARTLLGATLAQAEPEGYIRLFADEGQPMQDLLASIQAYTTASPAYIQKIQAALSSPSQTLPGPIQAKTPLLNTGHIAPQAPSVQADMLDPLSERERQVLSLLATGASNQQIADHLVISLNTAKRHVKHILAKLDAPNRLGAVAHARDLHLL